MAIKFLQILFFIALFLMLTNKVHSHTTSFTVDNFSQNPTTLTYLGDARVLSGNKFLSVAGIEPTGEKKVTSVGRVLYSRPIRFWEDSSTRQVSFETTIRFRIKPSLYGAADGVAFFIAPVNTDINEESIWGQLGIYNNGSTTPNIFAVEFDTNINFWDPVYRHAGINIESRRSRNVTSFNAGDGNHVTARINYDANTKIITVVADSGAQHAEVSYVFDLKTILPEEVEVGIASTTGSADEGIGIPEIHAWYFTSTLVQASNNEDTYIKQYVQQV